LSWGQKKPVDLRQDPRYYYMTWQLVGLTIMLTEYLRQYGDEKGKAMAAQAQPTLNFFRDRDQHVPVGGWEIEAETMT